MLLSESPLQQLHSPLLATSKIQLYIKREDLVDPELGGNKWRKLKYNLAAAVQQHHDTLLTFGGAYSNHIYATAAAGKRLGLCTIGLIRGEPHSPLNPTLQFAVDCGMQLEYIDRSRYRNKEDAAFINTLREHYGRFYLLPEGGSNALAVKGCAEIVAEIEQDFDFICSACGTGATLAGIISGLKEPQKAIGFAVLKGAGFLRDEIENFLQLSETDSPAGWQLNTDYHFGGYAKTTPELWTFIEKFKQDFDIPLDAVYTGKMFYGLFDLIQQGYFPAGSRIIAVHTGGVQGNFGFSQKHR
ncbi:MAG: pyridoxal-phosphate dependent enzyme [Gammaproteobacteria bacterium]|nr:pyridoxal-phosphate dependent enzyme [Gammaproteobacteria bacterium]